MVRRGNPNDRISARQGAIGAISLGAIQTIPPLGTDPEMLNSYCQGQDTRHTVGTARSTGALHPMPPSVLINSRATNTTRPARPASTVAQAQGLRWLLDDLLDAELELRALIASPSGLPSSQRQRLAAFCAAITAALAESPDAQASPGA